MSFDRARSPRPSLGQLSLSTKESSRSSPSSPLISPSSATFAFPQPSSAPSTSHPPPSATKSSTSSTTSRFNEAFASFPPRHQASTSTSSDSSDSSGNAFRFPPDSASPTGVRTFDGLQREFGEEGVAGVVGLGLGERERVGPAASTSTSTSTSPNPSPQFDRPDGGTRFYEEPEPLDDPYDGTWRVSRKPRKDAYDDLAFSDALQHATGSNGHSIDLDASLGGFGRPASMDMGDVDPETSFDFLLSPPPTFDASASGRSFLQSSGPTSSKGKERMPARERTFERTFPAPLLLKGDRPFGGTSSPVLGTTAPLSLPRKSSVSAGSTPLPSNNSAPPSSQPPSRLPWASASIATSSPIPPAPPPQPDPSMRHKSQNSGLSQSQSSISSMTYNHSQSTSISSNLTLSPILNGSTSTMSSFNLISPSPTPPLATSSQHSTTISDTPLPPQALLLYILSLRSASQPMYLSQSQGPLSRSSTPLFTQNNNHQRIRSVGSTDPPEGPGGDITRETSPVRNDSGSRLDTVDLSHKRIAEVTVEVIDELRDEVEKLALGYNLLRELPAQFSAFSKLRYLNVRVNLLTTFPQVLCEMPSLEILDISRNKIKRLPPIPGTLLNLKVFSIAKNRIKRLPPYICQMTHLKVLKVDHNPLEWPPKDVTYLASSVSASGLTNGSLGGEADARRGGSSSRVEDADEMQRWLQNLCRWMRENGGAGEDHRRPHRSSFPPADQQQSDEERTDRSIDSRPAAMTRTESGRLLSSPTQSFSSSRSRTTPPNGQQRLLDDDSSLRAQAHSRNASHTTAASLDPEPRTGLRTKKSLPDLRQSHADILAERRAGASQEDDGRPKPAPPLASALRRLRQDKHPGIVHSQSARAALPTQANMSPKSMSRSTSPVLTATPRPAVKATPAKLSSSARRPATPNSAVRAEFDLGGQSSMKRPEMDRSTSGGFDRNSGAYFRRLSMLPASTISKTVPVTLLEFADAIRGILFSLSQIYTALRQFVVFASQDRLPAPLARLMGSADGSMSLLINALDRFDSLSRRGTPSPSIVRDIFVTCRDNVAMFGKLVAALAPELKALVSTADVRYTRTLLLMLYGSTGEIANSWNKVAPLLSEMAVLSDDPSLATLVLRPATPSPTLSTSSGSRQPTGPNGLFRARSKSRRHAGSFSVEDVQLGAVLPPASVPTSAPSTAAYADAPGLPYDLDQNGDDEEQYGGGGTIKARPAKSRAPPMSINLPATPGVRDMIVNAFDQPMTPGPGTILFGEASNGDPAASYSNFVLPQSAPASQPGSFSLSRSEGPPRALNAATSSADEQFLGMVEATTGVAFDVYGMLIDSFDEAAEGREGEGAMALTRELGPRRTKELTDLCILGNEVTTKLTGSLGRVRGPDQNAPLQFSTQDARRLGEDSYTFVQTVIRFAKLVKAISLEHGFAPRVREGVGQLTISTRELAKHLSSTTTSFRPTPPSSTSHANSTFPTRTFT